MKQRQTRRNITHLLDILFESLILILCVYLLFQNNVLKQKIFEITVNNQTPSYYIKYVQPIQKHERDDGISQRNSYGYSR